jgi:hypothetical protein
MDRLSQEIINLIATFIERYPGQWDVPPWKRTVASCLPRYSTISQAWKYAIECIVFRKITLKSIEIDAFDAILRGNRRRFLKHVTLHVLLPHYDDKACGRFEREVDRNANNEAFTNAIVKLFTVLKSWEEDGLIEGSIFFALWEIYASSDRGKRDWKALQQHRFEADVGQRHDLFEHRYMHSLIHLLRLDCLPSIRRVAKANFDNQILGRNLAMRAVVDMAVKFPNLESLSCTLNDDEKHYVENRVINRHSFASVLSDCTFSYLKIADLTFFHESPSNQAMKPADLRGDQSHDPLSTALRLTFSQCPNLTSLTLTGVFDSSLFWPPSEQSTNIPVFNCWPNLQFLTVTFDPTTPSGHWYFTGPSGDDPEHEVTSRSTEDDNSASDSEDSPLSHDDDAGDPFDVEEFNRLAGLDPEVTFRTTPNVTHLNPFILAFANFVKNTASPFLHTAALTTGPLSFPNGDHFQFDIGYYAPNQTAYYGDEGVEDKAVPRLYFETGDWIPDPEVLQGLKEAGWGKWGDGLLIRFLKSQY